MHALPHRRSPSSLRDIQSRYLLLFDLAQQDGNIRGLKGPRALEEIGANPSAKNLVV